MAFTFKSLYRISFLLILSLLALGQIQRVQLNQTVAVYLHEIAIGLLVIISGFHYFFQQKKLRDLRPSVRQLTNLMIGDPGQLKFFALPLFYILFQTILYSLFNFQVLPLLYLARWMLYLGFFLALLYGKVHKFFTQLEIYQIILGMGIAIGIFGLIQYLVWPDTRWLINYGWDDHYYRLISTLFDPGFTALMILLSAIFYFGKMKLPLTFQQRFLIIPFFFITILLTYSRAGYLAFLAGLLVLSFTKKRVIYVLFILFFLLLIPFLPRPGGEGVKLERTVSIERRIESNQSSLQQLTPLTLAIGQGMYRSPILVNGELPQHAKAPDNSLIFLLSSFGIIGVLLLMPLAWKMLLISTSHPWLLACMIAWGTHALFNLSLVYPWAIVMIGMLWILREFEVKKNS